MYAAKKGNSKRPSVRGMPRRRDVGSREVEREAVHYNSDAWDMDGGTRCNIGKIDITLRFW